MVGRFGWRDAALLVLIILVVIVLVRSDLHQSRIVQEGKEAHDYLCYQKKVVIPGRISTSLKYLVDVQEGRRRAIPGITVRDIQTGVQRDEATLRALSRVHC